MAFTEQGPIEAGFSEVYQARVVPALERIETQRKALLRSAMRSAGIPLVVALIIALLLFLTVDTLGGAAVVLVICAAFGGVVALLIWRHKARQWGGEVAGAVMPEICEFLGDLSYDRDARDRFELDRMEALGVIGTHSSAKLEDRLEGRYRDTGFVAVEAYLRLRSTDKDDSDKTVFQGLMIRVETPEPIQTRILIERELGSIGNKLGEMFSSGRRKMAAVKFEHQAFEQRFETYADDPDAARDTMPPAFRDSLVAIGDAEGGRKGAKAMKAGFQDSAFYLALDRREPFMEMGSLTTPALDIEDDLHRVFADIATIRRIIDRLHGDAPDA